MKDYKDTWSNLKKHKVSSRIMKEIEGTWKEIKKNEDNNNIKEHEGT